MPGIIFQFHATPEEVIEWVRDSTSTYSLWIVQVEFFPAFKATIISEDLLKEKAKTSSSDYFRIAIATDKPELEADSNIDFIKKNQSCLFVEIGPYNGESLRESCFSSKTNNEEALKIWKTMKRKLTRETLSGAWFVNPKTQTNGYYKNHRYTKEAKKLFEQGVKILTFFGDNYYLFKQDV